MRGAFLFVFLPLIGLCQKLPIGQSTNYHFKNTLQNDLYNSSVFCTDNGMVQLCAFGGGISFKSNLEEEFLDLDSIRTKGFSRIYETQTKGKVWLVSENRIAIYQDNTFLKSFAIPFTKITKTIFVNDRLYYINYTTNSVCYFDGENEKVLLTRDDKIKFNQLFFNRKTQSLYAVLFFADQFELFKIEDAAIKHLASIKEKRQFDLEVIYIATDSHFYFAKPKTETVLDLICYDRGKMTTITTIPYHTRFYANYLLIKLEFGLYQLAKIEGHTLVDVAALSINDGVRNFEIDTVTNSIYVGTNNKPMRSFLHLTNYPKLFHNINSASIFTLGEDFQGGIYACSYQGAVSYLYKNQLTELNPKNHFPINGCFSIRDKTYFFDISGVIEIDKNKNISTALNDHQGYFGCVSRDNKKVYLGLNSNAGLWQSDASNFYNNHPNWKIIDGAQGMSLSKIYTILEDQKGRLWMGSPKEGFSIYHPIEDSVSTIKGTELNDFGPISSARDSLGGLWFGGYDSRLYHVAANTASITAKSLKEIKHPLLSYTNRLMSMCVYKNWLVIGAYDKVLLLDLKDYYTTNKVTIRYLNPNEANFTSFTEQNTMILAKDGHIWFSTSDNLYRWDIKRWLALPTHTVYPTLLVQQGNERRKFGQENTIEFEPTHNSFDLQIKFQSKDNLERYLNGVLVKQGDKPEYEQPNLKSSFQFKNLEAGDYTFYVRLFQQDGSYSEYRFPIVVKQFIWQKWWVWVLFSLVPIISMTYVLKNKNKLEVQKKKLAQLNLANLSNQFRPHSILNALNSVSSQLKANSDAEKVMSRLGDSINIIYGVAQENKFTQSFKDEWKLVENMIDIQRYMFIPELVVELQDIDKLPADLEIPIGLIQIPIENALFHGLRNRIDQECLLKISVATTNDQFIITIIDNGIGVENSKEINALRRKGRGLAIIQSMLDILNKNYPNSFAFAMQNFDDANSKTPGTRVTICLSKHIDYEKIKL